MKQIPANKLKLRIEVPVDQQVGKGPDTKAALSVTGQQESGTNMNSPNRAVLFPDSDWLDTFDFHRELRRAKWFGDGLKCWKTYYDNCDPKKRVSKNDIAEAVLHAASNKCIEGSHAIDIGIRDQVFSIQLGVLRRNGYCVYYFRSLIPLP